MERVVQRSTTTSRRTCQSDQALLALISRSRSTSYCCLVLHGRHLVTSRTDFSRSSTLSPDLCSPRGVLNTSRRSFATSPAGCEFQSGYASTSVFWRTAAWTTRPRCISRRASVGRLTSTAVVTSARRLRQLSSSRPFVDRHWATGLSLSPLHERGTVCRRPSELHRHFSLSGECSRHFYFCSGLTDITFAIDYVKCPLQRVFVTVLL